MMRSFLSLNQRKSKHTPALSFPQDSAIWFPSRHQLPGWGNTLQQCPSSVPEGWKEKGKSMDLTPKVVEGSKPRQVTLYIKNLPEQHQIHTWECPQLCWQAVLSALAHSPLSFRAHKEHGETSLPAVCSQSTPTWAAASGAFGLQRWQGLEEQPEINWSTSSEQAAIRRFYWSSQFSPTWLPTNENTATLLRGKKGVAQSGRFPSLRTQCSSFQLCEKGKCNLQPLVTPNKMLSSSLF